MYEVPKILLRRFGAISVAIGILLLISALTSDVVSIAKTEYIIAFGLTTIIIGSIMVLQQKLSQKVCRRGVFISLLVAILSSLSILGMGYFEYFHQELLITFFVAGTIGLVGMIIFVAVLSINKIGTDDKNKRDPSPVG